MTRIIHDAGFDPAEQDVVRPRKVSADSLLAHFLVNGTPDESVAQGLVGLVHIAEAHAIPPEVLDAMHRVQERNHELALIEAQEGIDEAPQTPNTWTQVVDELALGGLEQQVNASGGDVSDQPPAA